jgi:hypothetical protein
MAGVRRIKIKVSPATIAKRASKRGLRDLFLRAKFLFRKRRGLSFIKRLARLRGGIFYKFLRLKTLKRRPVFFPKSALVLPFSSPLRPLSPSWAALGFNLSEHERLFFSSAKTPSLTTLVRSISIIEKTTLLIYGATGIPTREGGAFVRGSLGTLVEEPTDQVGAEAAQVDGKGLVLSLLAEDGFVEPWPTINLVPLILTLVVFNPTARLM